VINFLPLLLDSLSTRADRETPALEGLHQSLASSKLELISKCRPHRGQLRQPYIKGLLYVAAFAAAWLPCEAGPKTQRDNLVILQQMLAHFAFHFRAHAQAREVATWRVRGAGRSIP
jgi:hypothetical protein